MIDPEEYLEDPNEHEVLDPNEYDSYHYDDQGSHDDEDDSYGVGADDPLPSDEEMGL